MKPNRYTKQRSASDDKVTRREIFPEIRVLDRDEGLVEYVASDETLDSYGEIILAEGWRFDERLESNPVFLNTHSMWEIRDVLGRLVSWEVKNRQLVEVAKWAIDVEENVDARLGFEMTVKGYLKAVSVGFIPVSWTRRDDDDFTRIADAAGITGAARDKCRKIFTEQQQMELSACPVGANPSALAKGLECGEIREEFGVAAGIVDGDEIELLKTAGRIIDDPESTGPIKDMARMNLYSHVAAMRRGGNLGKGDLTRDPAGGASDGRGAHSKGTRAQREETLRLLKDLEKKSTALAGS